MATDLLVKIAADASEFQNTLAGLGQKIASTIADLNPIAAGVIGVVGGIGIAAVSVADTWEEAFHTIQQGTGASGGALEGLKKDWEAVFKTGDEDAATVGKVIADVNTNLGLTGEQLQTVSRNFLDLAGIVGEDVNTVVRSCSQAFNDWKITGDDVAKSQDFLMRVAQSTGTSITEITGQLAQSGPTLRQLGLDFETSATLIGQLGKVGPGASEAMGGLAKAVTNLTKEGIPAKDALSSIIDRIKNAPSDTAAASDAMDVFGNRAGAKLAEQIRAGKFEVDSLIESLKSSTGTISEVDNATDGFSAKLGELWNNLQPILVPLGTTLIEAGSAAVTMLTDLVKWVGSEGASGAFSGLLQWLQPLADAFTQYVIPAVTQIGTLLGALATGIITSVLIPALTALWQNILQPMATFLRDVLVGAIQGVFGALNSFLEVLGKIPGVSSLVESAQKAVNSILADTKTKADDAKTSAGALNDTHATLATTLSTKTHPAVTDVVGALKNKQEVTELAKNAAKLLESADSTLADTLKKAQLPVLKNIYQAQSDLNKARDKAKDASTALAKAEDDLRKKLADGNTSAKDLKSSMDAVEAAKKNAKTAADNLTTAEGALTEAQRKNKEQTDAQKKALDDIAKTMEDMHVDVLPSVNVGMLTVSDTLSVLKNNIAEAKITSDDTNRALQALGVEPVSKLQDLATEATKNFNLIKDSGLATPVEVRQAHIKELEAIKAAYVAQGTDLPPEQQKTLDALKAQQDAFAKGSTGPNGVFTEWAAGIKSLTGTLGTDMVKGLFTDPGSFGGSLMDKLNTIKDSFFDVFTNKVGGILDDFIQKGISKLMGALDGVIDKLTGSGGVGSAFGSVFGSGGSAATSAAGAATSGGGAAGSAGSAGSAAASGLTGIFTAIGSIGSMISGIIGNFQNAKMETTMNAVEHNTRYTMMYVGERSDGGILGVLFKLLEEVSWGTGNKAMLEMRDWVKGPIHDRLAAIQDNTYWALQKLSNTDQLMTWKIPAQLDQLIAKPMSFSPVTKVYLDGKEIAAYIEDDLDFNGQLATA